MNYEEFIRPVGTPEAVSNLEENPIPEETVEADSVEQSVELDVQKAVVESLAAEKIEQDERIVKLNDEINKLKSKISDLTAKLAEKTEELTKIGDVISKVGEVEPPANTVALLERNVELSDKFEGETRDHVLEAIKMAYDAAEADGRVRSAKILESVMLANTPSGNLVNKRSELEQLFRDNCNIVSGAVIEELNKAGIPYKNGEEYLLPSEIIKRNY